MRVPTWAQSAPRLNALEAMDRLYLEAALRTHRRAHAIQNSTLSQTWSDLVYSNKADFTAVASTASEASLLGGLNEQPAFPGLFFHQKERRSVRILARGVLSTTGTPTIIFQVRLGTTVGSASLAGGSFGVSAAITTSSGVTNKWWELGLDLTCTSPGLSTGNCTLSGSGYVMSPGGFASPFIYPLEPSTPDTATWTQTLDGSLAQYLNLSCTWSASSASNTITLKQLKVWGDN